MRIASMLMLMCAGTSWAYAADPTPTAAQAAAPAAAPAAASTVSADNAAKAAAQARRAAAEEQIKKFGTMGYKPEVHGGTTVYCRKEAPIGSRFEQKTCRSYDQLLIDAKNGKEFAESLQATGVAPRQ